MCGRFTIISDPVIYQMEFDIHFDNDVKDGWRMRYNVTPDQAIPVVNNSNKRTIEFMQWGLIPNWSRDEEIKFKLINIRSETIMEKVSFKRLMQNGRRCFILADGFYEWQPQDQKGKVKNPFYFHLKSNKPLAFAGLWDTWKAPDDQIITTCAIITCAPNSLVSTVHNRMPVILDSNSSWEWLNQKPIPQLLSLLKPYPQEDMALFPVSRLVNNPKTDIPECILPVDQ